ncbi:MAG: hypothetical protein AAGA86_03585 [Bacteroidota bacterium]
MYNSCKPVFLALGLLLALGPIACNSDDNDDTDAACADTLCTAIFIRILVSVKDQDQDPVILDAFEVINVANGADMTIALSASELEGAKEFGQYPLVQDGTLALNETRHIQFKGFINGAEVITSTYTVSTDCCHVGLDSGDLELTL